MKIISFCVNGKFAHFRKYYSNSTSLSHIMPPVTTVKGIIAGLIGYERDSYYELFANDKCKVAICCESEIKKITQTVNLLKVKNRDDFIGAGKDRTQNNMEFVIPGNIRDGYISYRILINHIDDSIMERLSACVCPAVAGTYQSKGISVALGAAQCIGWIDRGEIFECDEVTCTDEAVRLNSAVPVQFISKLEFDGAGGLQVYKEEFFTEFDSDRKITEGSKVEVIFSIGHGVLNVKLKPGTRYCRLDDSNIIFLE